MSRRLHFLPAEQAGSIRFGPGLISRRPGASPRPLDSSRRCGGNRSSELSETRGRVLEAVQLDGREIPNPASGLRTE